MNEIFKLHACKFYYEHSMIAHYLVVIEHDDMLFEVEYLGYSGYSRAIPNIMRYFQSHYNEFPQPFFKDKWFVSGNYLIRCVDRDLIPDITDNYLKSNFDH